jgi:hypothetical protein
MPGKYLVAVPQTSASGADIIPAMLNQEVVYPNQALGAFLDGPTTRDNRTTFNGTPVVTILNLNPDSRETLNADTLYLTATATPMPLRIEGPRGFLDFQDFGTPVAVTAPPTSQIATSPPCGHDPTDPPMPHTEQTPPAPCPLQHHTDLEVTTHLCAPPSISTPSTDLPWDPQLNLNLAG